MKIEYKNIIAGAMKSEVLDAILGGKIMFEIFIMLKPLLNI